MRVASLFMRFYKPIILFVLLLVGLLWSFSFEGKPPKIEPAPMIAKEIRKDKLVALPEKEKDKPLIVLETCLLITPADLEREETIEESIGKEIDGDIEKGVVSDIEEPNQPEKSKDMAKKIDGVPVVVQEKVLTPKKTPTSVNVDKVNPVIVKKEPTINTPVKPVVSDTATFLIPAPTKGFVSVSVPPMKKGYTAYVVIEKGKQDYSFKLEYGQNIPLPFESGVYNVILYQGDKDDFIEIERNTFTASFSPITSTLQQTLLSPGLSDTYVKQIMSSQFKDWKSWSVKKRIQRVHAYITTTYQYDYKLAENPETWYLPSAKRLVSTGMGICYDLASLNSSLLREMEIPTRVVMGYATGVDIYHAWNEVYVNNTWKLVDTTIDLDRKVDTPFKDAGDYNQVHYRF